MESDIIKFTICKSMMNDSEKCFMTHVPKAASVAETTSDTISINAVATIIQKENNLAFRILIMPDLDSSALTSQIVFNDF